MNVNRSCATFHGRTENLSSSPAYAFAMLRARRASSIWCDCYVRSFFWNSAQFFEGVRMPCHLAFKRVLDCILFNSHRIADAICCQRMALQCLRLCASVHPPTDESMTATFSVPLFRSSVPNATLYLSDVSPHTKTASDHLPPVRTRQVRCRQAPNGAILQTRPHHTLRAPLWSAPAPQSLPSG